MYFKGLVHEIKFKYFDKNEKVLYLNKNLYRFSFFYDGPLMSYGTVPTVLVIYPVVKVKSY
jgi:hypothetical protein